MGYRDRTVIISLEELGDGCRLVVKNPALHLRAEDYALFMGADDAAAVRKAAGDLMTKLVISWTVWDVDTDEELPIPSVDPAVIDKIPEYILNQFMAEVSRRINPQRPPTPTSDTSSTSSAPPSASSTGRGRRGHPQESGSTSA